MGLLAIHGTLDIRQFWPTGDSDADTLEILNPSFGFASDNSEGTISLLPAENWKYRTPNGELAPIVTKGTNKLGAKINKVRVRLQGIDAPELHYQPKVVGGKRFRQFLAESSALALHDKLRVFASPGQFMLPCVAKSHVSDPKEAFDIYGRLVGNVSVQSYGFSLDLNYWLLENGWAFASLYNSMSLTEMEIVREASAHAMTNRLGIFQETEYASNRITEFGQDVFRKLTLPNLYDDSGPVMNPKFYRRQATHFVKEQNKPTGKTFIESLASDKNYKGLPFHLFQNMSPQDRNDIKKLKRACVNIGSMISPDGLLPDAREVIFVESPSAIYTEGHGS